MKRITNFFTNSLIIIDLIRKKGKLSKCISTLKTKIVKYIYF